MTIFSLTLSIMAPYFGCYRCHITKQGLQCLDMDSDGYVDWKEFLVYNEWALHQYPDVSNADELLDLLDFPERHYTCNAQLKDMEF